VTKHTVPNLFSKEYMQVLQVRWLPHCRPSNFTVGFNKIMVSIC